MSKPRLVDTNLIVRYLVQDHEKHARAAGQLFRGLRSRRRDDGGAASRIGRVCVCARVFYRHPRTDIAAALGRLISSPGVEISEVTIHLDALNRYKTTKAHFVDCVLAATAVYKKVPVSTFDQDFRKFVDVRVATD